MSNQNSVYSRDCQAILKDDLYIKLVEDSTNTPIPNVTYILKNKEIEHSGASDGQGMKLEEGLTSTPFTATIDPPKSV
ncbi:hypothetical protein [Xenorhabdus bovienii]|uniref:Uncharacterized protein n=1 Tax=Xenorhabdus bovienii str. Intermedium TaxID=1379677 RepID=A0A077QLJ2_XENBV|nr:hypothetical protein [Xenorhabdus bovienii]MDE1484473.1 hypothetical protein [Xenorhabdus bovienii]MDE9432814.1 hypothetical protein [Xenorhabdus bovienii]MDE9443669.1 hypothetical protein [Xenorhabdus bovienii]MDE9490590.1 hypothetical protein [Xenorhabdus bovienii]MDE9507281.1 hypothetical protein [Xenorhabdus bovienii]